LNILTALCHYVCFVVIGPWVSRATNNNLRQWHESSADEWQLMTTRYWTVVQSPLHPPLTQMTRSLRLSARLGWAVECLPPPHGTRQCCLTSGINRIVWPLGP